MIPFDMHYQWPGGAYLVLFVTVILLLLLWLYLFRKKALGNFVDDSLPIIIVKRSSVIFWTKALFLSLAWISAVLALMQPVGKGHYPESNILLQQEQLPETAKVKRKAHDLIFLIDASASMGVKDARLGKSRLEYAKDVANAIVGNLSGESASLQAFTSQTTQLSPLTMDYLFFGLMLENMQINEGDISGTDLVKALADARRKFYSEPSPKAKTVIILSDGGDTSIESSQGDERKIAIKGLENLVANAEALNLRVYVIGVGSKEGGIVPYVASGGKAVESKLQEDVLRSLALHGRGVYFFANDYTPLEIAELIQKQLKQDPQYYDEGKIQGGLFQGLIGGSGLIYDNYFQIPLGLAILLLSFCILFPDAFYQKKSLSLIALLFIQPLYGIDYKAPYPTEMRQAGIYLEAKMYDQALVAYNELLEKNLNNWQEAIVKFNLGNVYSAQRNWEKAIKQYSSIGSIENLSPLFILKLNKNLALAHYWKARDLKNENVEKIEFSKIAYHLNQAKIAITLAMQSECTLQEIGEITPCKLSEELSALMNEINVNLNEAKEQLAKSEIKTVEYSETSEGILHKLIDMQEKILFETREENEQKKESEKPVLVLAEKFLQTVYKEQKEKYNKEGMCQSSPWGEALPHFDNALQAAKKADSLLVEQLNYLDVIAFQEQALEEWKNSLDAMLNPKNPKGTCYGGSVKEEKSAKQEEPKQEKEVEQQPAPSEEVLRSLLEMNLEDAKERKGQPAIKQVSKPW